MEPKGCWLQETTRGSLSDIDLWDRGTWATGPVFPVYEEISLCASLVEVHLTLLNTIGKTLLVPEVH